MWFPSLQNFGSRWGPYNNKVLWSWEAFGRWCPDALDWCCLLEDELQLDSGTFLFLCNEHEEKRREKKQSKAVYVPLCLLLTPVYPTAFLSFFLEIWKPQFSLCLVTLALLQWLQTGQQLWPRIGRKEATSGVGWGHNQSLDLLLPCCGLSVSFTQVHISWQCWGWPGIQTWSAQGRVIILKCFYRSVDFLSPSFSFSLHPARLLKTHLLSHTTKIF